MRSLITGINGFVGTYLSQLLLKNGCEVIGIDRKINATNPAKQYELDLNDHEAMAKILADTQPDHIYHLAAPAFIPDSYDHPQETFNSIIFDTVNILEAIRMQTPKSKFLYVGSSDEYGLYNDVPFNEEMLPYPCTPYASAKVSASFICYQYAKMYQMNVVRTRPFNHIGPGQSPRFVSASMARQIATVEKNGGATISLGNLSTSRDFLDVRDVVRAYCMIMSLPDNSGELYNICSGQGVSIQQVLDMFLSHTSITSRPGFEIISEDQHRKFDNTEILGSNAKLQQHTKWTQQYPLEQTILETLNYWRKQI